MRLRPPVRVLVHRAYFYANGPAGVEHLFIKITNRTRADIELTHVWFWDWLGPARHVINAGRPLPVRLLPQETFETWIPLTQVRRRYPEWRCTVLLSSMRRVHSRPNWRVPKLGQVAGAGQPRSAA